MFDNDRLLEIEKENHAKLIRWDCLKLAIEQFQTTSQEVPAVAEGFYQYVINGTILPITSPITTPPASQITPTDTAPAN